VENVFPLLSRGSKLVPTFAIFSAGHPMGQGTVIIEVHPIPFQRRRDHMRIWRIQTFPCLHPIQNSGTYGMKSEPKEAPVAVIIDS
jgi:hypothetical protein